MKMPAGSNSRLSSRWMRSSGGARARSAARRRCRRQPAQNSVAWPPARAAASRKRCASHRLGAHPALAAVPFDQRRLRQVQHRRGLRHRQPPKVALRRAPRTRAGAGRGTRSSPAPPGRCPGARRPSVLQAASTAATRAAQAQVQGLEAGVIDPAAGVQRQRPAAPVVQAAQGLGLAQLELERGLRRRDRQHLQADLDDQAQRAEGAGHQARHVIARHVLHDLAAEGQQLAAAVDHGEPQHEVAHGADAGARRAAQARGDHAAHRRAAGEVRRLERQALAALGQHGFQLGQRRAGAHGDHQLARLVAGDAAQAAWCPAARPAPARRRNPCCRRRGCAAAWPLRAAARMRSISESRMRSMTAMVSAGACARAAA